MKNRPGPRKVTRLWHDPFPTTVTVILGKKNALRVNDSPLALAPGAGQEAHPTHLDFSRYSSGFFQGLVGLSNVS